MMIQITSNYNTFSCFSWNVVPCSLVLFRSLWHQSTCGAVRIDSTLLLFSMAAGLYRQLLKRNSAYCWRGSISLLVLPDILAVLLFLASRRKEAYEVLILYIIILCLVSCQFILDNTTFAEETAVKRSMMKESSSFCCIHH